MSNATPSEPRITPRRPPVSSPASMPRDWFGDDRFLSQFFDGLSLSFPAGEKYFIDSVRTFRDRIRDPRLAEDVRAFMAQEAQHIRGHADHNAWLRARGMPVDELLALSQANADRGRKLTPLMQLGATAALEHYTALLASRFAEHPEMLANMHEDVRLLWIWHALEEIEHKSVAFDVYEHVGGRYWMRVALMVGASVQFAKDAHIYQRRLQASEGRALSVREWIRGYRKVFGPSGPFHGMGPRLFAYLRPDFHPSQQDDTGALRELRSMYEAELKAREARGLSRA